MSSTSQPNTDIQSQYVDDNIQGHSGQFAQSYSEQNDLSLEPLLTTPIHPFPPNIYPLASSGFIEPPNRVGVDPSQPAATSLVQHASWGSGLQSLPQHVGIQSAASGTPISLPEASSMRYLHNDLPVLSAEQYDDGHFSRQLEPTAGANVKPNNRIVPVENAPNPRKRGRKPADQRESAEEPKRTRGRPRLETKDQTPTEVSKSFQSSFSIAG
ncbi:hypothetical protein M434DRAFT_394958 [Hypoxylon sp. CO27-5]|nr:hypothetical protein M434DRAFT_394958 [Hypoxylon sp. CO27-5]